MVTLFAFRTHVLNLGKAVLQFLQSPSVEMAAATAESSLKYRIDFEE
jgi:hypothetical protein